MTSLRRFERLVRSTVFASPLMLTGAMTRFEIFGRETLLRAVERSRARGTGLITISNHQSLFDDPIVLAALLDLGSGLNVETKRWWSTPCQANFHPAGDSLRARFVRYFSDVSNMVFFARAKNAHACIPPSYARGLAAQGRTELCDRIETRAASLGLPAESYLRRFVTEGDRASLVPLNQIGMVEACARIDLGDWLHFFPEGSRSRGLHPGTPKRGIGKVIYHGEEAEVLPFCFCGMHEVLPIHGRWPRPWKRVVVFVGEPLPAARVARLRRGAANPARFQELADVAWESIQNLWPLALARYERQAARVTPFSLARSPRAAAPRPTPVEPNVSWQRRADRPRVPTSVEP